PEVAGVVIERGFAVLGARAGSVALLERGRETLRVVRAVGYPDDVLDRWHSIPIDAPVPIADAVRTGEPIILRSPEELKEKYSEVASFTSGSDRAWAAVPMIVEGEVVGAIGISFAEEPEMEEDETSFLLALARQCGQALERTRLYDSEQEA